MSVESVSLHDAPAETGELVIPDYAGRSLSNLLPSAITAAGLGGENLLGLPRCRRICVLLVDGLGSSILRAGIGEAPFLRRLLANQLDNAEVTTDRLTAGFPSTTGASLASIGTGLPPSRHGLVGYRVLIPEHGRLMSLLRWDDAVDPSDWQPHPTVFEQLADAGIPSAHIASYAYESSGLTRAAFRGARYVPSFTSGDLVASIARVAAEVPLVFGYYSDLDQTGHGLGVNSEAWRHQLALVDRMLERLVAALPADTTLVVTADHGMIDVSEAGKRDVDADPSLREGVALVGGEARARHLYTEPGAAADVLATWRERLAESAWIVSRRQAIDEGWFGPGMSSGVASRVGDVVVAARSDAAIVATVAEARSSMLRGMHGSLTADEQYVPLMVIQI